MARGKAKPKKLQNTVHPARKTKKPRTIPGNILCTDKFKPHYFIKKLLIGLTMNALPEQWSKCRARILSKPDEVDSVHIEFDSTSVVATLIVDSIFLKEIFSTKIFSFKFSIEKQDLFAELYFLNIPLQKFNSRIGNCLKTMFSISYNDCQSLTGEDVADQKLKHLSGSNEINNLYKNIAIRREELKNAENGQNLDIEVQHKNLLPNLRLYQKKAVCWMLEREKKSMVDKTEILHPLYEPVTLSSGLEIYFDKYSGDILKTKPMVQHFVKGGILADEMGLGKTVELLALILNHTKHKKPQNTHLTLKEIEDKSLKEPENECPIIEKPKKRKYIPEKIKKPNKNETNPKKIKVPENWVKNSSKKSDIKIALELWYETALSEVAINKTKRPDEKKASCLCGNTGLKNAIQCVDCKRYQHKICLGYKDSYGIYRCPQCWTDQPLLESGATLIVTPVSLRTQWSKEISRHIKGGLKVLIYEGASIVPVYPTKLQEYDLVITTYNVLQKELRLSDSSNSVLEYRKMNRKYSVPGSPLTRIKWWRLCLDEAQTVETPTKMVSEMAKKIHADFRWAVTGTPISKNISDIFGLLDYLQMEPYNELDTWQNILYHPYLKGDTEKLCTFLSKVLWRTSKEDVLDQINIPKQSILEHWLEFSAVERFFYDREHEFSSNNFLSKLDKFDLDVPLQKLDKKDLKKVLAPLLSLRQASTYPNTEKGRYLATKKNILSMRDLLEILIVKNNTECEETLRLIVSAYNGMAGIYILLKKPNEAIEKYREVLHLAQKYNENLNANPTENNMMKKAKLSIDKLQLIHAMFNLAELLETTELCSHTLRDEFLRRDCQLLEQKYIEQFIKESTVAYDEYQKITQKVTELQNSFEYKEAQWFLEGLQWISINEENSDFIEKVRNARELNAVSDEKIDKRDFTSLVSIQMYLVKWDDIITELREKTIKKVQKLFTYDSEEKYKIKVDQKTIENAVDCHLRPDKSSKKISNIKICDICLANDALKEYEFKLFFIQKKNEFDGETRLKGSWKPTSEEITLKTLHQILKQKYSKNPNVIKDGETHLSLLESIKKEFKELRKLWTFIDQQICAQDELDMCKMRLTIKKEEENDKKHNQHLKNLSYTLDNRLETIHMLNEHELEYQKAILKSECKEGLVTLERSLGTQSYLETLKMQQYEGQTPDPCPICKNVLENHWCILHCGHSYCLICIQILIEQSIKNHIVCCICREKQHIQNISHIKTDASQKEDESSIIGSYSTKVEGVIKLLNSLKNEDSNVRVIIFSTWVNVLRVLYDALIKNSVKSEIILAGSCMDKLEKFKDPEENINALLLPISLGGKGLNLIEATHVVLVEPLLNPGEELQAIGRVHRIGQTKPTFVHKFLIKNTIEESIHQATSTNSENWDKNKLNLRQLASLFGKNLDNFTNSQNLSIESQNLDDDQPMEEQEENMEVGDASENNL